MANPAKPKTIGNRYFRMLVEIFQAHHDPALTQFEFDRDELSEAAARLGIKLPKNLGDVIYSFRYRTSLQPKEISSTAKPGHEWIIEAAGRSKYLFKEVKQNHIRPRLDLMTVKIPDATPEIVLSLAQGDEQALLAKVRYNRLIDVFLGITAYSLQNHLRTTVKGRGQIEVDELYVGIDRFGCQYVVPVQAKGGKDQLSVVQARQDLDLCSQKFSQLVCRAVSAQFLADDQIAMFELTIQDGQVKVVDEKHYKLVAANEISIHELQTYRKR
jgi:hypothetical protein